MPPNDRDIHFGQGASFSFKEKDIIASWEKKLQEIGFAKSVQIIPKSLVPTCSYSDDKDCFLNESRIAAARLNADAILFLNDDTVVDEYSNVLSILNLTIVGMWIVPAHHLDAYSVYEASLFDVNNGYLYAVASGKGTSTTVKPLKYTDRELDQLEAREKALEEVGERLISMAKLQMDEVSK